MEVIKVGHRQQKELVISLEDVVWERRALLWLAALRLLDNHLGFNTKPLCLPFFLRICAPALEPLVVLPTPAMHMLPARPMMPVFTLLLTTLNHLPFPRSLLLLAWPLGRLPVLPPYLDVH